MIMQQGEPSVHVSRLNYHFGSDENSKQVLYGIDLDLLPGEIAIMTGPSGSGKTTLLTLIGALRTVQEGVLQVIGRDYSELSPKQLVRARRDIGFIFQTHNLFDSLTAFRNVRMALELHRHTAAQMRELAEDVLCKVGLAERIHYKPNSLSSGQNQRVAVARALVNRPKLILADEPTAALDEKSGKAVVELLRKSADEDRATVLLVTHDNRILGYADRIVNMVDGRIASDIHVKQSLEICQFLQKCSLFEKMTPGELTEISQKMVIEQYVAGDVVIREGDVGDKFYIMREGTVRVEREDDPERVAAMSVGEAFGEAALLTGEARNATIVATSDVEVYALDKESFQQAIARSANFSEQLREVFFRRMYAE